MGSLVRNLCLLGSLPGVWIVATGCVTKAKADAQARAAFAAGQREALLRVAQSQPLPQPQLAPQPQREPTVTVIGQVKTSQLGWTPGMTVAQAIVASGYSGASEPTQIFLIRTGIAIRIDPNQLLRGKDVPLQPGDVLNIK